jgi:NAD(P)-dependent dehydrogenase (short-subunit alcohol dehydrogenase family)
LALALDVTEPGQVTAAVEQAEDRFGGVDVLVNNAGYGYRAAVEEGDDEDVRRLFDTNFFGARGDDQSGAAGHAREAQRRDRQRLLHRSAHPSSARHSTTSAPNSRRGGSERRYPTTTETTESTVHTTPLTVWVVGALRPDAPDVRNMPLEKEPATVREQLLAIRERRPSTERKSL